METKEANSITFWKKQSHNIKFQHKLMIYSRTTRDTSPKSPRSLIKSFKENKPKRSSSGGTAPRNRIKVGNSGKTIGCSYCFLSLNNMINKRSEKKADIHHNIQFEGKLNDQT